MIMDKKKILVVTGTRAEYGLLRSTMDAIRAHPGLELKLLATGMHTLKAYGNTQEEIKRDGYRIDCTVPIEEQGDMLDALSQEITGIKEYCAHERPDCIVVLGDRDEPFAAAIVAGHLNIPLAHIHGGDVTGPGVDESIRHSITKFAHIHFPSTERAAARIRSLAEDPSRIFCVGTPAIDGIATQSLLNRALVAKELALDAQRQWLTFVLHPVAYDQISFDQQIGTTLLALEKFPEYEKIVLYPNSDTGGAIFIKALQTLSPPRYHVFPSLPRTTYLSAVKESLALIGNSSAGIIETASLGTPTVDIGNRQRGRERGASVTNVRYDTVEIERAIEGTTEMKLKQNGPFPSPYGSAGAGTRIADILSHELERPDLLDKTFIG